MAYIHSILASNRLVAADGDLVFDLPVNPLSVVLLQVAPLNETSTIGNYRLLEGLLASVTNVEVVWKSQAVLRGSLTDLAVLAMLWQRMTIWQSNAVETDNDRRSIVVPLVFGRRPYDPAECFPRTLKGELQMTLELDIAASGFDGLRISIETIELPDAAPERVQKVSTLATTFAATGQQEIDLPIGNLLRGVLLFGTTGFAGAAPAPSLGQVSLLVNNRETGVTRSDFEVLRAVSGLKGIPFPPDGRHIHSVNAAGAGREDTLEPEIGASIDDNYVLIDLDPLRDDQHSVATEGVGRVHVRVEAETADAVRALPIEAVPSDRFAESS